MDKYSRANITCFHCKYKKSPSNRWLHSFNVYCNFKQRWMNQITIKSKISIKSETYYIHVKNADKCTGSSQKLTNASKFPTTRLSVSISRVLLTGFAFKRKSRDAFNTLDSIRRMSRISQYFFSVESMGCKRCRVHFIE